MIETPETPHVHHGSRRWFDVAVAIAIVLVSSGSLYVSLHTGKTMEQLVEQNARLVRANSVPLLAFDSGNIDEGAAAIYMAVQNVGTGPARITWFEIRHGDRQVKRFDDLLAPEDAVVGWPSDVVTSGIAPSMMPAGERRLLLKWPKPPAANAAALAAWDRLDRSRHALEVEACYCSVFEECWITTASADVPKPVKACDVGDRISYDG